MTRTVYRYLSAATLLAAAALSVGGCGASDEEEIRSVTKEFMRLDAKDADRACELITARAQAQLTAFVGDGECETALKKVENSDEQPKPREIDKAALKIRDDRAVMTLDEQRLGLRKVDGDWRVDNLFNATLVDEPRRLPTALSRGSDEQQVRASMKALSAAYRKRDYERACDLLSYGAEAQLFVGLAFASFADTEASKPPADASCAWVHRKLERIIGTKGGFADEAPSVARIDAAKVSIRGDRATVGLPGDDWHLIRQDGHWLMAGDPEGSRSTTMRRARQRWNAAGSGRARTSPPAAATCASRSTARPRPSRSSPGWCRSRASRPTASDGASSTRCPPMARTPGSASSRSRARSALSRTSQDGRGASSRDREDARLRIVTAVRTQPTPRSGEDGRLTRSA